MKKVEDVKAYEIIEKREIKDINSMSYLLKHKKTRNKRSNSKSENK